jgi:hypothetical protein
MGIESWNLTGYHKKDMGNVKICERIRNAMPLGYKISSRRIMRLWGVPSVKLLLKINIFGNYSGIDWVNFL